MARGQDCRVAWGDGATTAGWHPTAFVCTVIDKNTTERSTPQPRYPTLPDPTALIASHGKVEREAAELDWRQQSGRTVAGRPPGPRAEPAGVPGGGEGFVLVKEAFEGGSGRLGGDSSALTQVRKWFVVTRRCTCSCCCISSCCCCCCHSTKRPE